MFGAQGWSVGSFLAFRFETFVELVECCGFQSVEGLMFRVEGFLLGFIVGFRFRVSGQAPRRVPLS